MSAGTDGWTLARYCPVINPPPGLISRGVGGCSVMRPHFGELAKGGAVGSGGIAVPGKANGRY